MIAHILAVFDIKPALDETGNQIPFEPDVTGGLLTYAFLHLSQRFLADDLYP